MNVKKFLLIVLCFSMMFSFVSAKLIYADQQELYLEDTTTGTFSYLIKFYDPAGNEIGVYDSEDSDNSTINAGDTIELLNGSKAVVEKIDYKQTYSPLRDNTVELYGSDIAVGDIIVTYSGWHQHCSDRAGNCSKLHEFTNPAEDKDGQKYDPFSHVTDHSYPWQWGDSKVRDEHDNVQKFGVDIPVSYLPKTFYLVKDFDTTGFFTGNRDSLQLGVGEEDFERNGGVVSVKKERFSPVNDPGTFFVREEDEFLPTNLDCLGNSILTGLVYDVQNTALAVKKMKNATVTNCSIKGDFGYGINSKVFDSKIYNNEIEGAIYEGIRVSTGNVTGNVGANGNEVSNNTILSNDVFWREKMGRGIIFSGSESEINKTNFIQNNLLKGPFRVQGIAAWAPFTTVKDNVLFNQEQTDDSPHGITVIHGDSIPDMKIQNNKILDFFYGVESSGSGNTSFKLENNIMCNSEESDYWKASAGGTDPLDRENTCDSSNVSGVCENACSGLTNEELYSVPDIVGAEMKTTDPLLRLKLDSSEVANSSGNNSGLGKLEWDCSGPELTTPNGHNLCFGRKNFEHVFSFANPADDSEHPLSLEFAKEHSSSNSSENSGSFTWTEHVNFTIKQKQGNILESDLKATDASGQEQDEQASVRPDTDVTFNAKCSETVNKDLVSCNIDFGDGTTQELLSSECLNTDGTQCDATTTHAFSDSPECEYDVVLTSKDSSDAFVEDTVKLLVTPPNNMPVADLFQFLVPEFEVNETVTFTGSCNDADNDSANACVVSGNSLDSCVLDFGDGTNSGSLTLNANNEFSVDHVYDAAGVYAVNLTANDKAAEQHEDSQNITIGLPGTTALTAPGKKVVPLPNPTDKTVLVWTFWNLEKINPENLNEGTVQIDSVSHNCDQFGLECEFPDLDGANKVLPQDSMIIRMSADYSENSGPEPFDISLTVNYSFVDAGGNFNISNSVSDVLHFSSAVKKTEYMNFKLLVEETAVTQDECTLPNGQTGFTGEDAKPDLFYSWNYNEIGFADIISKTNNCGQQLSEDALLQNVSYCDSTQFAIALLNRLELLDGQPEADIEMPFTAFLMKDAVSDDFRQDFDAVYRGLKSDESYNEKWHKYLLDSEKLSFEPNSFDAGKYKIILNVQNYNNAFFDSQGEPVSNITVEMQKIAGAPANPLYEIPFDGELGIGDSRAGYGLAFNFGVNENIVEVSSDVRAEVDSGTRGSVFTKVYDSLNHFNYDDSGVVLRIDDSSTVMEFSPTKALPVLGTAKVENEKAEMFYNLIINGTETFEGKNDYALNWTALGATGGESKCKDLYGSGLFSGKPDSKPGTLSCASTGFGLTFENVTGRENDELKSASVFYAAHDDLVSVQNECSGNPGFDSEEFKVQTLENLLTQISDGKLCVIQEQETDDYIYYWNKQALINSIADSASDKDEWLCGA